MADKPLLRGWIHGVATPAVLVAVVVLACQYVAVALIVWHAAAMA